MELRAGDFITNQVRLLRPLAEGGMGRVWVAEHLGLESQVVVKLMAEEMVARADGASRFAREAAVAAAIKSPHVVQVFDHGVTKDGVPYIVMELLEGKDLGQMLHERGRLEPHEAAQVIVQVGKALAKAHRAGIIHRDVKPENIFLTTTDAGEGIHVKLLDFGTAKESRLPGATLPGEIMGTPYYMSPEQSVGAIVDERTDMWSLGVVAFETLTGTKPFEGANVGAIALAIHGRLPMVSSRTEDLPGALDPWFLKACAQVSQDRFASMREMTSAFVEALTGTAPLALEATEQINLPARKISVRPAQLNDDDLRKTMPTKIEQSVPPPAMPVLVSDPFAANAANAAKSIIVEMDSIAPLAASLPDRSASQRPTKIAAGMVGVLAAAVMGFIVFHHPAEPTAQTTTTAAAVAPPPAPAPEPPVAAAEPPKPPAPKGTIDTPSAAPAPHKKSTAKHAAPAAAAAKKGTAPAKSADDDLEKLIKAGPAEGAAPDASKPAPSAAKPAAAAKADAAPADAPKPAPAAAKPAEPLPVN